MSTHDLIGQGLTLITGPGGDAWLDAATKVAAGTPYPISAHVVGADLDSADGIFCERFGLGSDGAVLVRPDGHIAWRREAGTVDGPRDRSSRGRRRGDRLRGRRRAVGRRRPAMNASGRPVDRSRVAQTAAGSGSLTVVGRCSRSGSVHAQAAPWKRPTAPWRAASTRSGSPKISMKPTAEA